MRDFATSPVEMALGPCRHRHLLFDLIARDVAGRYRGSVFGIVWALVHPLLLLAVYTFVFGYVFAMRWPEAGASRGEVALALFAGWLIFQVFAECANRAPTLVLGQPNFVKKVVFPLELFGWMAIGTALFHLALGGLVWLAFHVLLRGMPPPTAALLPLLILPAMLFTLGSTWLLASLGVYLRDIAQFAGVATTALMFLSPVFYPLSAVPETMRDVLALNPLALAIEDARAALLWGRAPVWGRWALGLAGCLAFACIGFAWFQKTRRGFADVV